MMCIRILTGFLKKSTFTTKDRQLHWFQTRLLHCILPTQRHQYLCKISDSPICKFCKQEQTLVHLYWHCATVGAFWGDICVTKIHNLCPHCARFRLCEDLIVCGVSKNIITDKVIDLILLLAKLFIHRCNLQNSFPTWDHFQHLLNLKYNVQKQAAALSGRYDTFQQDCFPYIQLLG